MRVKEHLSANLKLAIPVVITQLGQISVNLVDNIMVGKLGTNAKASVSIGNSVFFTSLLFVIGFSFAMSPLIASEDSKKNFKKVADIFSHGMVLNLTIGTLIGGLLIAFLPAMYHLNQPPEIIPEAVNFLLINLISLLPLMIFQTYRQFSEAISQTVLVTIATVIANIVNIFFNYALVYGHFGFPAWGVEGSATATLIARVVMMVILVMVLYNNKKSKKYLQLVQWKRFERAIFKKLFSLGFPTAFQLLFEVSAFAGAALICGLTGKVQIASHQIAQTVASASFMLCTGFSVAATVRVGNFYGLNNFVEMRKSGYTNIFTVAIFMLFAGSMFVVFKDYIPLIFVKSIAEEPEVVKISAKLMVICAFFQLFDGIQLVSTGSLRGMQDVKIPTLISFVAYWVISIPLGYFLCVKLNMGAVGMWTALGIGLTTAAILLFTRFTFLTRQKNKGF